jgi:hypothetical protein
LVAPTPTTMRTMPPATSAREKLLFVMAFRCAGAFFFGAHQTGRRPCITLSSTMTTATTSRM